MKSKGSKIISQIANSIWQSPTLKNPAHFTRNIITTTDFKDGLQIAYDGAIKIAEQKLPLSQHDFKHPDSINSPNEADIADFEKTLKILYNHNPEFRKGCDNFYREISRPNCNGVIINGSLQKEKSLAINGYASLLLWGSFLKNFGFKFNYQSCGGVSYAFAAPKDFSKMLAHQDYVSIPKKSHLEPAKIDLAHNLALIGAYCDSNMQTWIVESEKIFKDLKKADLFDILTTQKFAVVDLISGEKQDKKLFKQILIKKDKDGQYFFDGFDARNIYIPITSDPKIKEKAEMAIKMVKDILERGEYRLNFTFHHDKTQLAVLNNQKCLHGRDGEIKEEMRIKSNHRWMLVYGFMQNFLGSSVSKATAQNLSDNFKSRQ